MGQASYEKNLITLVILFCFVNLLLSFLIRLIEEIMSKVHTNWCTRISSNAIIKMPVKHVSTKKEGKNINNQCKKKHKYREKNRVTTIGHGISSMRKISFRFHIIPLFVVYIFSEGFCRNSIRYEHWMSRITMEPLSFRGNNIFHHLSFIAYLPHWQFIDLIDWPFKLQSNRKF